MVSFVNHNLCAVCFIYFIYGLRRNGWIWTRQLFYTRKNNCLLYGFHTYIYCHIEDMDLRKVNWSQNARDVGLSLRVVYVKKLIREKANKKVKEWHLRLVSLFRSLSSSLKITILSALGPWIAELLNFGLFCRIQGGMAFVFF